MTFAILCLLTLFTIGMSLKELITDRVGYLNVPFLAATIVMVWYLPQGFIVLSNKFVPEAGQLIIASMALLSLAAVIFGWKLGARKYYVAVPATANTRKSTTPLSYAVSKISSKRLYLVCVIFVFTAASVQFLISRQPPEALLARQPTGLIVILRTLSIVNPVALFLSFMLLLQKRNIFTIVLFFVVLTTFVGPILIKFKRNEMMELGVVVLFCLWSMRRFSVPRIAIPVFAVVGVFILFGASAVRQQTGYKLNTSGQLETEIVTIDTIKNIDWGDVLTDGAGGKAYEVTNGAYAVDYATKNELPTFGARFWNNFIFQWVPGQIVGYDLKNSLLLEINSSASALDDYGATWLEGTTFTGFTEIYLDFSYPSVFVFFLMAFFTRRNYDRGLCGDLGSAAVYGPMAILVMVSFTHGGYYFFLAMPLVLAMQFGIRLIVNQEKLIPANSVETPQVLPNLARRYGARPALPTGADI